MEKTMRLQKYLAQCGVASRRKSEELIAAGRVKLNDSVVREMGVQVNTDTDMVFVDNKPVYPEEKKVYILLNKPMGVICAASDPFGRKTVLDVIGDVGERIYPVGRLDYETEGLLLLTNDGDFAQRVLHPSFEVEKTYYTVVIGRVKPEDVKALRSGVQLDDGPTAPARVEVLHRTATSTTLLITIHEGRNRQVRRMLEAVGYNVQYLRRDRFAHLSLEGTAPGSWRFLSQKELADFKMK